MASLGGSGLNGYQEEIDQISIEYLTDLSRISKISAGYLDISQIYLWTVIKESYI